MLRLGRFRSKRVASLLQVRCLRCTQELSYNSNTSSMLRHLRARHDEIHSPHCDDVKTGSPDSKRRRMNE